MGLTRYSTMRSKGRLTVSLEIRRRLGLKAGDRVEFIVEDDRTVILPARGDVGPFKKFMEILGPFPGGEDGIKAWIADMRNGDDRG